MTKLPGMSSKDKLTTPMTESESDFLMLSSDKPGAAMDVEKYFSPVERGVCLFLLGFNYFSQPS